MVEVPAALAVAVQPIEDLRHQLGDSASPQRPIVAAE